MMIGSASWRAAAALLRLPAAIASSTFRTTVRRSERRLLLISVRRAILRVVLRAELVLPIASMVNAAGPVQAARGELAARLRMSSYAFAISWRAVSAYATRGGCTRAQ